MLLTDTIPTLTTRDLKERWLYTKPKAFTQEVPPQTAPMAYALEDMTLHTLQPHTWHHGTWAHTVPAGTHHTVIEVVTGTGDNTILTDDLTLTLEEGADLTHIRLHTGHAHKQRRVVTASLEKDATYRQFTLTVNGALSRTETDVTCVGEHAHAELFCLALAKGKEHVDGGYRVRFAAPNCTADVRQRSIVAEQAFAAFQGKFHVDQIAQKTDAYMLCQNVLLDEHASVAHKPELEIYADDVKCSHGATTGTLDEEHLFYLQSRGISAPKAKQMLIAAHVHDMLENLPDAVAARALATAEHWLKEISHA